MCYHILDDHDRGLLTLHPPLFLFLSWLVAHRPCWMCSIPTVCKLPVSGSADVELGLVLVARYVNMSWAINVATQQRHVA